MLDNAISSIIERNDSKQVKGLLLVIRLPQDTCFEVNINDIHEVIVKLGEELECKSGLSIMDNLQDDQFELIVVIGF